MATTSYIKCPKCGIFSTNKDYCDNCGTLISHKKKKELRAKKVKDETIAEAIEDIENPNLAERLKKHPFFLVKIIGWLLQSVLFIVSAIGMFLAWCIAMIAAG